MCTRMHHHTRGSAGKLNLSAGIQKATARRAKPWSLACPALQASLPSLPSFCYMMRLFAFATLFIWVMATVAQPLHRLSSRAENTEVATGQPETTSPNGKCINCKGRVGIAFYMSSILIAPLPTDCLTPFS